MTKILMDCQLKPYLIIPNLIYRKFTKSDITSLTKKLCLPSITCPSKKSKSKNTFKIIENLIRIEWNSFLEV